MRVFVFEYLTALGQGRDPASPDHHLFREGRAMRDAVADDFRRLPGCDVRTIDAIPPAEEESQFRRESAAADWSLVIAPEFDALLEVRCGWVLDAGGRLLGPTPDAVRQTGDKLALADLWRRAGVPTPRTWTLKEWPRAHFPAVVKPQDGAGSTATVRVDWAGESRMLAELMAAQTSSPLIAQDFVPGTPASVAVLCGPATQVALPPAFQRFGDGIRFRYDGGELPIPSPLAERAVRLASKAVACVPGLLGYVGVDLVLGDAADGSADAAIELNPRLTTSYVGLRAGAEFNLTAAILAVATGGDLEPMPWSSDRILFRPDGSAERIPGRPSRLTSS